MGCPVLLQSFIVRTLPPLKGGGEGVNFHYLPRRGESEILKKGWKYGAGASLLQKGGGLTLFLFNCFKFYHFYI